MTTMRTAYNRKKSKTLKNRNCGFELSYPEYVALMTRGDVCDYTGKKFKAHGALARTIERVDDSLPYRADNCCCVTDLANRVKNVKATEGKLKVEHMDTYLKVQETLKNKTREELVAKYQLETPEVGRETLSTPAPEVVEEAEDVAIASAYVRFAKQESSSVNFTTFKRKYKRKTCELSGVPLESADDRHYISLRSAETFTNSNILVVHAALKPLLTNKDFTVKAFRELASVVDMVI